MSTVLGFVAALIGAVFAFYGSKYVTDANLKMWLAERKEKYRELTFEGRLQAHQEAFNWIQKLTRALNQASNIDDLEEARETIWKVTRAARDWWDNNALYLDNKSRREMIPAINRSAIYFTSEQPKPDAWDQIEKTKNAILDGIGSEHLPPEIEKELKDLDKSKMR